MVRTWDRNPVDHRSIRRVLPEGGNSVDPFGLQLPPTFVSWFARAINYCHARRLRRQSAMRSTDLALHQNLGTADASSGAAWFELPRSPSLSIPRVSIHAAARLFWSKGASAQCLLGENKDLCRSGPVGTEAATLKCRPRVTDDMPGFAPLAESNRFHRHQCAATHKRPVATGVAGRKGSTENRIFRKPVARFSAQPESIAR